MMRGLDTMRPLPSASIADSSSVRNLFVAALKIESAKEPTVFTLERLAGRVTKFPPGSGAGDPFSPLALTPSPYEGGKVDEISTGIGSSGSVCTTGLDRIAVRGAIGNTFVATDSVATGSLPARTQIR